MDHVKTLGIIAIGAALGVGCSSASGSGGAASTASRGEPKAAGDEAVAAREGAGEGEPAEQAASAPPAEKTKAAGHAHGHGHGGGAHAHHGEGPPINDALIPKPAPGFSEALVAFYDAGPDSAGDGDFRTVCKYSHMAYDDPIVFPGQPGAAHLHMFFGNTEADAHSTGESLANEGASTCKGGILNRTGYWMPALIDGSGTPIVPRTVDVYYKHGYQHNFHGDPNQGIEAWGEGLRMIAGGDPMDTELDEHASIACGGGDDGGHEATDLRSCHPGEKMRLTVEFPACWDGENLDSEDHRSHMSYGVNRGCPKSHPVPIPVITVNVVYDVPEDGFAGAFLSSDFYDREAHPSGQSLHADWFDGWDHDVVQVFLDNCVNKKVNCGSHLLGDGNGLFFTNDQLPDGCDEPSQCPPVWKKKGKAKEKGKAKAKRKAKAKAESR